MEARVCVTLRKRFCFCFCKMNSSVILLISILHESVPVLYEFHCNNSSTKKRKKRRKAMNMVKFDKDLKRRDLLIRRHDSSVNNVALYIKLTYKTNKFLSSDQIYSAKAGSSPS